MGLVHGTDRFLHVFSLFRAVLAESSEWQDSLLVHQTRSIDQGGVVLTASKRGLLDRDDSLGGNALELIVLHGAGLLHLRFLPSPKEPRLLLNRDAMDIGG